MTTDNSTLQLADARTVADYLSPLSPAEQDRLSRVIASTLVCLQVDGHVPPDLTVTSGLLARIFIIAQQLPDYPPITF